ncbi:hypothetical protein CR105_06690 [Massilia eurypsychrophila]|jgi:uncharacterized membrane protein YuzA (DUF378 family)|uniref:DUF378 domain-containing protein n=1 Tax=Massilia eurypsychrophila TaxID=1485217 RepID=A0A2G8TI82_9BURK|nr:DUF378 domain-containing protein [Massilia eurypsychrophila]PIL45746.1 hypothetical protein CR105_06690 [Massilia eurypsychrophila]
MATMNIPNDRRHIPERRTSDGTHHGAKMSALDYVAMALLIIGGLNWAMVGLFSIDVVATLFGVQTPVTRFIYVVVGLAALYAIYLISKMAAASRH